MVKNKWMEDHRCLHVQYITNLIFTDNISVVAVCRLITPTAGDTGQFISTRVESMLICVVPFSKRSQMSFGRHRSVERTCLGPSSTRLLFTLFVGSLGESKSRKYSDKSSIVWIYCFVYDTKTVCIHTSPTLLPVEYPSIHKRKLQRVLEICCR